MAVVEKEADGHDRPQDTKHNGSNKSLKKEQIHHNFGIFVELVPEFYAALRSEVRSVISCIKTTNTPLSSWNDISSIHTILSDGRVLGDDIIHLLDGCVYFIHNDAWLLI